MTFAPNEQGQMIVLQPGPKFQVAATNVLDDAFMSLPALVGKAFYFRTRTHLTGSRTENGGRNGLTPSCFVIGDTIN